MPTARNEPASEQDRHDRTRLGPEEGGSKEGGGGSFTAGLALFLLLLLSLKLGREVIKQNNR